MQQTSANPFRAFVNWIGGWTRFMFLVAVLLGVIGWYLWERGKDLPVPAQAQNVTQQLTTDSRDTNFVFAGSVEDLRAFYQKELPPRGWRYCGTRATAHCTNQIALHDPSDERVDIYRRADDQNFRGPTIEIFWLQNASGQLQVSIAETRGV
ncbi:MAG TPA: hypothetical protein VKE41_05805 [Roseiflexaceae bacterium]|nr:hypothetical protein [Roseiflexaceae bacterium]